MARKQARRRKVKPARKFEMPKLGLSRLLVPLAAIAVVVATYDLSVD